jgi:glycosyltransferase involved in cell wall biosynthesis
MPVTYLLARKLRLLADLRSAKLGFETGEILKEHARYIELMQQRVKGLEVALAEPDKVIRQKLPSNSWHITRPLRRVKSFFTTQNDVVLVALRRSGGIKPALRKAVSVLKREGWNGLKLRISPDQDDYSEWIRRYDTLTDEARATMRAHIVSYSHKPLISVVMPTYNPKPEWLIEAIESVRKQIYSHWELCIADDASSDKSIRPILERYAQKDPRIKVVYREQNGHISAASNSALELATGEWIALLDHDDLLAEHALFWVADAINRDPAARLIYSDEDKIDTAGERFAPYFKCDWNVDLFYSQNLISHLGVYRANLLREIGGFQQGFEGSQDYDLALRCVERIAPKQIHHISRVLYHWRINTRSTAQFGDNKPYAMLAGERALNEHFQRQTVNAVSKSNRTGYRVRYALPDTLPLVSLIIATRNGLHLVQRCVESILKKTTYQNYEIQIVDNGSDDPATLQYFKELQSESQIRVLRDDRFFNYSAILNTAVKLARGELVGLINNDIEVISPDWLSEMVSHALRPHVGAVGAKLLYLNETFQHAGVVLGLGLARVGGHPYYTMPRSHNGYFGRATVVQSFSAVTGACLVIRKEIFGEVGGFNEMLRVAFNDIDFCLRVREAGYRNVWTPYAELYHHESATRGFEDTGEKQGRFSKEVEYMKQRWGGLLLNDPAYSPNLSLLPKEDFRLAWPPRVDLLPPTQVSKQVQLNELLSH